MPGRTIAIGDIHGCSAALNALLHAIEPTPEDRLIPLGDYVDRGPDTRGVLDRLTRLVDCCELVPLLGNHELMMLESLEAPDTLQFWLQCGGADTLASYGDDPQQIPEVHLTFLRGCRRYFETENHLFFHANYDPELPPEAQPERLLFWEHLNVFDSGEHTIPGRHYSGKVAIVGHTPQESGEILDLGDVICIDTCCFGDGWLTALDVDTRQVWQADRHGRLR